MSERATNLRRSEYWVDTVIHRIVVLDAPTSCWSILGVIATFLAVIVAVFTTIYFEYKRRHEDLQLSVRMMSFTGVKPVREYVELTISNISPTRSSIIENIPWTIDGCEHESLNIHPPSDVVNEAGSPPLPHPVGFKPTRLRPLGTLVVITVLKDDITYTASSRVRVIVKTRGERTPWYRQIPLWCDCFGRYRWSIKLKKNEKLRSLNIKVT